MKIVKAGHRYMLDSVEGTEVSPLQFIDKEPVSEGSTELKTVNDGTTNEEVLRVLIDRMQFLQAKMPCRENEIVLIDLHDALRLLEQRTASRVAKGIEGTNA